MLVFADRVGSCEVTLVLDAGMATVVELDTSGIMMVLLIVMVVEIVVTGPEDVASVIAAWLLPSLESVAVS